MIDGKSNDVEKSQEKSLMGSYARLTTKVTLAERVEALSIRLLEVMKRAETNVRDNDGAAKTPPTAPPPDIIDLFDNVDERLERHLITIESNLENIILMIG